MTSFSQFVCSLGWVVSAHELLHIFFSISQRIRCFSLVWRCGRVLHRVGRQLICLPNEVWIDTRSQGQLRHFHLRFNKSLWFILVRHTVDLNTGCNPGIHSEWYTSPWQTTVNIYSHPHSQLEVLFASTVHSLHDLWCGRKPEDPQKTHRDMGWTCKNVLQSITWSLVRTLEMSLDIETHFTTIQLP